MKIISIFNNKGGVGKTTTTKMLGKHLAKQGNQVLLIDNDPQGNLSGQFETIKPSKFNIEDVMGFDEDINESIESTITKGIDIVTSSIKHQKTEVLLIPQATSKNVALVLEKAIKQIEKEYDYILIDCAPSIGLNVTNALAVSDEIIVPITTDIYSLEGIQMMIEKVEEVKANFNPTLKMPAFFINKFNRTSNVHKDFKTQLSNILGDFLIKSTVGDYVVINESTFMDNEKKLENHQVFEQFEAVFKELRDGQE